MLEPWLRRYQTKQRAAPRIGATISVIAHALLVAAAIGGTRRPAAVPGNSLYNRVYYLPPPNARPRRPFSEEHIEYVALSLPGPLAGSGTRTTTSPPNDESIAESGGSRGRDYATTPNESLVPGTDSVYNEVDVDSVAIRFLWSAAPQYPAELLRKHVQGAVRVQYVVDTSGYADTTSFRVVLATDTGFAAAVRAALPRMRFSPAMIGSKRVRQLVEQDFTFRIADKPKTESAGKSS